ncbi:hypothetical protein TNIN_223921 [Trichonephila inaurata madagascariensis]|uniref:Uncharacterized protein n=1 Tax=Trichonephila inaurata madagascariensis TaxID=2747483 RepID=A0A8X6YBA8_9ARAC|nr:hypothetical protein TNIN_223921 [Trichonephila inaurata madagascariensis]
MVRNSVNEKKLIDWDRWRGLVISAALEVEAVGRRGVMVSIPVAVHVERASGLSISSIWWDPGPAAARSSRKGNTGGWSRKRSRQSSREM